MVNVTKVQLDKAVKHLNERIDHVAKARVVGMKGPKGDPGPEGKQGPPGKDAPTPAPPVESPSPQPTQDLLFEGDTAAAYTMQPRELEAQIQPAHTVEWVQAPDGSSPSYNVAKISVSNIDGTELDPEGVKITSNPRGELKSPAFPNDQEVWWSFCYWLPQGRKTENGVEGDFPASIPGWWNIAEGPYGPGWNGSPPFEIDLRGTGIGWRTNSHFPGGERDIWREPYVRGKKHSVLVRRLITGISVFHDGDLKASTVFPTIDPSNSPGPQHYILQNYRKRDMYMGTATIYYWPLKIGTTRESVEYK